MARSKTYTILNIAGLAIGIAVCTILFIIIQYQTSFDTFHAKRARIYRVLTEQRQQDGTLIARTPAVPFPLPAGLKTAFPQLEQVAPVYASQNDELQLLDAHGVPQKSFKEQHGVFYTTPSFFSIFDFPLLAGTYASLKAPNQVLLTKETAATYFGDWKTATGKNIRLTGSYRIGAGLFQSPPITLKVAGILENIPANSDFQLKIVVSYGTDFTGDEQYGFQNPDWHQTAPDFGCYVLLSPGNSMDQFTRQLNAYGQKMIPTGSKDNYLVQNISEVHQDAQTDNYSHQTISHQEIDGLWLIAAFILLIACVNFINGSTAQAINRAKEVGVRKVLGSRPHQLQLQFIVETFLIVTGAALLAISLVVIGIPVVNRVLALSISFRNLNASSLILFVITVMLLVTLLAGCYPAVVLSRLRPVYAFRNKLPANMTSGMSLRRGLVVGQFVIAQALIIATLVVARQMKYCTTQPLGFDTAAMVQVPFRPDNTGDRLTSYLRQQLLSLPGVQSVSFCSNTPIESGNDLWTTCTLGETASASGFQSMLKFADDHYLSSYQLQLVAGRNVQPSGMTREFLVNEALVKKLGFTNPEDVLSKELSIWDGRIKCPIVGVLKDFKDRSFHHALAPLIVTTNGTMYRQIAIKLATNNMASTLQAVQQTWKNSFPDYVFEYRMMEDKIEGFYKQEQQLSSMYQFFSAIAILLSCLGLYGLASFMAVQRTKEIGIRKVLGANAGNILYLFSKEFTVLIILAFLIATPIAWYYGHQWLQNYTYRISIDGWPFVGVGLAAIGIALTTISFQAIKAAKADPVKSLKAE